MDVDGAPAPAPSRYVERDGGSSPDGDGDRLTLASLLSPRAAPAGRLERELSFEYEMAMWGRLCGVDGCTRQPTFGLPVPGSKPSHCTAHATDDMVNMRLHLCRVRGCGSTPRFAVPGHRESRCLLHKEAGMVEGARPPPPLHPPRPRPPPCAATPRATRGAARWMRRSRTARRRWR